jgi:deoxyadenosine/deoxycytidine kinase
MKKGIVIEGPNGSGKSTLAKQLSIRYKKSILHSGPDDKSTYATLMSVCNQLKHLNKGGILDRCTPVSKQIYQIRLNIFLKFLLNILYKLYNRHIIIFCVGKSFCTDKEYYEKNHFKYITAENENIRFRYKKFFNNKKHIKYSFIKGEYRGSI